MESYTNPSSMKAAVVTKFGDPKVISVKDEYPIPKITKPNEVLVRMYATSVNPGDCFVRSGTARLIGKIRPPYVAGIDGSGVVVGIGEKVTKFKVGDEVFGEINFNKCGCAAQYCLWEDKELSLKPKNMDFTKAASLPVVGFTAVNGITKKGELKSGERVLVIGAAGGIGSFSVQYAKALGAYVIGVCSTNNVDFVKSLGADQVIDYKTQKFKDVLTKEEDKVDMVFDTAGDLSSERQGFAVLKSKGRYIPAALSYFTIFRLIGSMLRIIQPYKVYMSKPSEEILEKIVELVEQGKITANEIKTFPLESLADAHRIVEQKRGKGKVVVVIP